MQDEVLEFINRRFQQDCNWLNGNCYYFALILKDRFPYGKIVYDTIYGHFFFEYKGKCYDYSGKITLPGGAYAVYWENMNEYDRLVKERVIRDCIM